MPSDSLSSLQLQIVQRCDDHQQRERSKAYFSRCIVFENYFIKYGSHRYMYPEYMMQQYISSLAEGDTSAPRIPKVYDYFTPENYMAYIVMEYIEASPTPTQDAPEKVADALQWLRRLPAPPDATIGSVAGPDAPYTLFKNFEAPFSFSSIEALERYLNEALNYSVKRWRPEDISLANDKLVFTQSDVHEGNFLLDTEDKMCLVDFGDVALLPESFGNYGMAWKLPFIEKVASYLDWPRDNVKSMGKARGLLLMIGDPRLGLNKHGFPSGRV